MNIRKLIGCVAFAAVVGAAYASGSAAIDLFNRAKEADNAGKFDVALTLYLKADSAFVAERLTSSPEYARSMHNTGRAYFNNNQMERGREYTKRAMTLNEKLYGKVSKEYTSSMNNYALSYIITGDCKSALPIQQEVVSLCSKMNPSNPDEGMYLINLSRIYQGIGDDDNAIKYMEEALGKVEKSSTNYKYALAFLTNIYIDKKDNANVARMMKLSRERVGNELNEECSDLKCHLERADYYSAKGDNASARDEYMAAFKLLQTDEQKVMVYEKYASFLSFKVKDFAQAGDYLTLTAQTLQKIENESERVASLYSKAGLDYFSGKEYAKSAESHKLAIAACDKYGYSEKIKATSLAGLGNALRVLKDYQSSISTFGQLIEHLKANGHEKEAAYAKAYEKLAFAEKQNKDYDASIDHYQIAIDLYGALGMYDEQSQAENGLQMCKTYARKQDAGSVKDNALAMQQRYAKTRAILNSSLNSMEQSFGYLGKLSDARNLSTIAYSYAMNEEYDKAIDCYSQYVPLLREAICEEFLLKSSKERELIWDNERKSIVNMEAMIQNVYKDSLLYSRLITLTYDAQLLSKGILLSSDVEFDKIMSRYATKEMQEQYDDIKQSQAKIESMRQSGQTGDELLSLIRETDSKQLKLSRECAQYGSYTDYLRYDREAVLKSLGSDEAAIEFVTFNTGVYGDYDLVGAILLCDLCPDGLAIFIGSVKDIKAKMNVAGKFASEEFGQMVWGNIMKCLGGKKKIYFSPDGILNNIGIEYLQYNGAPISERIELARVSSTKEVCRTHPTVKMQYASLFGNIDYTEDGQPATVKKSAKRGTEGMTFSNLDNTEREVEEIASIIKKANRRATVKSYKGTAASRDEFLSQENVDVNILHIATHGKYIADSKSTDAESMKRSILAFAGANLYSDIDENEGIVNASDIANMSLQNCSLVVLSACESGLGKLGDDGVFGLQRGFKNAGVSALLVSLNEVADESTADMMIAFYRYYFDSGMTMREAFRNAQAEIRKNYPNDDTWASFILIDAFN